MEAAEIDMPQKVHIFERNGVSTYYFLHTLNNMSRKYLQLEVFEIKIETSYNKESASFLQDRMIA